MSRLFIIQLIASFLVGGSLIALLSFIAERSSERIAGMIISLPSTAAVSLFFIGWTLSPETIALIAPLAPLTASIIILFTITYLYLSKIQTKKPLAILWCATGSVCVWLLLSLPLAILQFSHWPLALLVYGCTFVIGYYFITVRNHQPSLQNVIRYTTVQKIQRAIIAGGIITLAVFLSKVVNPFWGAIVSYFPVAYLTTFIILHWHYDSAFLFKVWKNSPLGSLVFITYPLVAMYTFPAFGIIIGTLTAYAASLVMFMVLRKLNRTSAT